MRIEKLTFQNAAGDHLSGLLDLPADGRPVAYALFAHCFTCSKHQKAAARIARALTQQGLAVLRFDFTGLGESMGRFEDTNFSSNVADLAAAADYLAAVRSAPQMLIGHSLGGAAVLHAAGRIPACAAVATINAPADPRHVNRLLAEQKPEIEARGEAAVEIGGRKFNIKKQFLEDLESTRMQDALRNLKKALLVLHAPLDEIVGIDNAADIFKTARHPKSFVSLDQADHLLSAPEDADYAGAMIAAWAMKYIDTRRSRPDPAETTDYRVLSRTGASGYRTDIIAGRHSLLADEPEAVGGTDAGPTPYDLLVAGLGACTSMTLRMYADRKQWPLQAATVRLNHRKIHARDCSDCENQEKVIDTIEREIELTGDLDDRQRERLLQIADRCPVHRTLHARIDVHTRLREKTDAAKKTADTDKNAQ